MTLITFHISPDQANINADIQKAMKDKKLDCSKWQVLMKVIGIQRKILGLWVSSAENQNIFGLSGRAEAS